jgi:uncharacterized iron-regulated membrane protein
MSTLSDEVAAAPPPVPEERPERGGTGLFRAFWRWHFYASVLVVPIMLMLALTGLTILYKWQLDPLQHPGVLTVEQPAHGSARPLSAQEDAVRAAFPKAAVTAVQQGAANRATFFTVTEGEDGPTRNVYVDPFTGKITGSVNPDHLLSNVATEIHGKIVFGGVSEVVLGTDPIAKTGLTKTDWSTDELKAGDVGDRIIELATCWAIVMMLTGYCLLLRGRTARLRRIAAGAKAAAMRNNHARYGAILGIGFALLVASGLPWTGLWGNVVQHLATGQGSSLWGDDPGAISDATLGEKLVAAGSNSNPAPWAEGAAPVPTSGSAGTTAAGAATDDGHAGHAGQSGLAGSAGAGSVNIDGVMAAARADGLPEPYYITYPDAPDGVFSVLADQWHDKANPASTDVAEERTVHRRGDRPVRLRRLLDGGQGRHPGHRPARGAAARIVQPRRHHRVLPGRHLPVRQRAADVVEASSGRGRGRGTARPDAAQGHSGVARRPGAARGVPAVVRTVAAGGARVRPARRPEGAGPRPPVQQRLTV